MNLAVFGTEIMYLNNRNNAINTERKKKNIRGKTCEYRSDQEDFSNSFRQFNKDYSCIPKNDINLFLFFSSGASLKPRQEDILPVSSYVGEKVERKENMTKEHDVMRCTAFGKALHDLTHSEKVMDDLSIGRRAGFYELRGEIGSGNFSHVRLGIHDLTKGEMLDTLLFNCPTFSQLQ